MDGFTDVWKERSKEGRKGEKEGGKERRKEGKKEGGMYLRIKRKREERKKVNE